MIRMRRTQGFTLLELLLAVTVLGLIIISVYRTWSTSLTGWKRATEVSDSFQRERVVMDVLRELTRSVVFFPSNRDLYQFRGTSVTQSGSNTVSFVTAADILLPPGEVAVAGLRRVTLALQRDEAGEVFLGVHSVPALAAEGNREESSPVVISRDVVGFEARYRHPRTGEWVAEWSEQSFIPDAVEYTIAFRGGGALDHPIVVTRALDLPVAQGVLAAQGDWQQVGNTTNEVRRREIEINLDVVGGGGSRR